MTPFNLLYKELARFVKDHKFFPNEVLVNKRFAKKYAKVCPPHIPLLSDGNVWLECRVKHSTAVLTFKFICTIDNPVPALEAMKNFGFDEDQIAQVMENLKL